MPETVIDLGKRVKAKYKGQYDDLSDDELGRRVKAKFPDAYADFVDVKPQEPQGVLGSFQTGVAGPFLQNVVNTAADIRNAPLQTLERVARGGGEFLSGFDPTTFSYRPAVGPEDTRLTELRRQAEAARPESLKQAAVGQAQEAARPRTTAGKIAYGIGSFLGEAAFPTAPETAIQNIVLAGPAGTAARELGIAFRTGIKAVGRRFGRGAAQIIEAEATPAALAQAERELVMPGSAAIPVGEGKLAAGRRGQLMPEVGAGAREVRPDSTLYDPLEAGGFYEEPPIGGASADLGDLSASMTGPSATAPLDLGAAVSQATASLPSRIAQRAKDEFYGLQGAFKSLRSSLDISYPFRQGALLMFRPLQWRQAGKMWQQMFRAFRTKNFDAINEAIAAHPDAPLMKQVGLDLTNIGEEGLRKGEEAFFRRSGSRISETVGKIPGIKHSEQAYTTAANVQRVEAFMQYKRLVDKAGLSPEEAMKGYKAAAQYINAATGRGSLGQRIDKAFDALNLAFFSPRYVASRLNILNPVMYARNAFSPGGRVVLKQQAQDLVQFAGVVATTMYLAKSAGADVELNYNSPDFLKIKVGNWRYDPLAGLQQVMRLVFRTRDGLERAARGQKSKPGQSPIDIAETFLSYKLSPPAGVFRDFINQRTIDRKPFTYGGAVRDLIAPMQWADWVEAYQKEGWGGVGMASPGFPGVGVQNYELNPIDAAIEKNQPMFTELQRLNKRVAPLVKKKDEKDEEFNARTKQFSQNYNNYGLKLLSDPRFQQAPDDVKGRALDRLNERAKRMTGREFAFPDIELDPNMLMDAAETKKPGK